MSPESQSFTRVLDQIQFKEGDEPTCIFTIDLDFSQIPIEKEEETMNKNNEVDEDGEDNSITQKFQDHINREKRKNLKKEVLEGMSDGELFYAWEEFVFQDEDFLAARTKFTEDFYDYFLKGYEYYVYGDWNNAKVEFERANVRITALILILL